MEPLANIIDTIKYTDPGWAMLVGSLGSLYFTIKIYKERTEADRSGVGIKSVSPEGLATLINDSRIDCTVSAEKYILEDGKNEEFLKDFLLDFFGSKNKKDFILKKIKDDRGEEIISEQILGSKETISFPIHDLTDKDIYSVFALIKLRFNSKERFYLYYYSNKKKIEESESIPLKYKNKVQPYNIWVKAYSF